MPARATKVIINVTFEIGCHMSEYASHYDGDAVAQYRSAIVGWCCYIEYTVPRLSTPGRTRHIVYNTGGSLVTGVSVIRQRHEDADVGIHTHCLSHRFIHCHYWRYHETQRTLR